jgi:hypothetical protein
MASLGIYIDEDWEINRPLNNSSLKRRISPVKIPSNIFPAQSTNLGESASLPQYPAVIRYLVCVYVSHFFAGRPYHFNQALRTANKF